MLFYIWTDSYGREVYCDTDDLSQSDYYCFCQICDMYDKSVEQFEKSQSKEDLIKMNRIKEFRNNIVKGKITDVINNKKYNQIMSNQIG